MDEPEMKEVASIVGEVLRAPQDEGVKEVARGRVAELVARFPAYA
jgi:glycine/serine hydroxymethyltransferase